MKTPAIYNATVVERQEIHPKLMILRVRSDHRLFSFVPGQFAILGLLGEEPRVFESEGPEPPPNQLIRRAYSIASSILQRQYVEFYINAVLSGQLTPRLFGLRPGSRLFLGPKSSGVFTLDRVAPQKPVVLISTGTGLAPYVSMLRSFLLQEPDRKFIVLQGARYRCDLGYRSELETWAQNQPNLTYIPSLTREDPHFSGPTGRVQTLLDRGIVEQKAGISVDPKVVDVFLCGNPEMIKETQELLRGRGYHPDQGKQLGTVHVEEYW